MVLDSYVWEIESVPGQENRKSAQGAIEHNKYRSVHCLRVIGTDILTSQNTI